MARSLAGNKLNHLAGQGSPYLRQHSGNPVDWYPWGDEALKKAKNDGKPILLSIGYYTCHWCHQMRRESFEDPAIAAMINKNFIPIKVDREEHPEVDSYYMSAVQAMTGSGGWPLTAFLTPDLRPFYGGTYYPPEPRYGMPSFRQVLEFVVKLWKEKRGEINESADRVAKAVLGEESGRPAPLGREAVDDGYQSFIASFDQEHGGFGGAPKFPLPLASAFLLRYYFRTGKELALKSVTKTLDEMAGGGIRDHVGGGFHRYATDRVWLVPHFEKMLYDNALLLRVYVEAYQATRKEAYARVAREIAEWLLREMRHPEGGFYSAQDADTEAGEGTYYTWTEDEVRNVLGALQGADFCAAYGVTKAGNFEGRSILHVSPGAEDPDLSPVWKKKLYEARVMRPRPATDTKVLTSWNGLAVSALAFAGRVLQEDRYLRAAEKAAEFVTKHNSRQGRLLRRFSEGESALEGTLEDYAFFLLGLTGLFEATGRPDWLEQALALTKTMVEQFEDREGGGFYLTVDARPARLKESYDAPSPSGNSVAVLVLLRLAELTGDDALRKTAQKALEAFGKDISQRPTSHAFMLAGLDLLASGTREVVITARTEKEGQPMTDEFFRVFAPDAVFLKATAETFSRLQKVSSLLEGRSPGPKARAYVCRNFTCKLPADSPSALHSQLEARD